MDIKVKVVASGKKAKAYAVVSPLATTGNPGHLVVVKPTIEFLVDCKKTIMADTNENGRLDIELGNDFKRGPHTVTATVFDATSTITTTERFTIGSAARKPTGTFGKFMMLLFWFLVWYWGPGWLTVVYLALTMVMLGLIAGIKGVRFGQILGNNNWVFGSILGMIFMSWIGSHYNPLLPSLAASGVLGWLGDAANKLKTFAGFTPQGRTLSDSIFWSFLNRWFFGHAFTSGWKIAFGYYLLWFIPAVFVSFSDEVVVLFKELSKKSAAGGGWIEFLKKDLIVEALGIPFKAIFRGLFH